MAEPHESVRVWDPFIRVFHWSLVVAWVAGWLTAEGWDRLHAQIGYFVLLLIGLRVLWGLVGTRHARFAGFVRSPSATAAYLRRLRRGRPPYFVGHNPAGGWMVVMLLAATMVTAASGALIGGTDGMPGDLHEAAASFTMLLIGLHVAGVIIGGFLHRENLVRAMITGNKRRRMEDV